MTLMSRAEQCKSHIVSDYKCLKEDTTDHELEHTFGPNTSVRVVKAHTNTLTDMTPKDMFIWSNEWSRWKTIPTTDMIMTL